MDLGSLSDGKSMWMDGAGAQFWLIPDGTPLASGAVAIRDVFGVRRSVDAAALQPFAITRDDAEARARAKIDALGEALKQTVAQLLGGPAPAAAAIEDELQRVEHAVETGVQRLLDGVKSAFHFVETGVHAAASLPGELEKAMRAAASRLAALTKRY